MNVFELFATISLDTSEYDKGVDDSKKKAESLGSKIASGLGTAAKIGAAALGAAATGVAILTKSAVSGFAEQEQLIGGVQKLYGNMGMSVEEYAQSVGKSVDAVKGEWSKLEQAQNTVLENARNAYKTAGMSMNEYMDTATSFSAALINSLGGDTVKAAQQTDVAMRAISDNFNTFGGDISMIQGAFQGFAKQNYTMLDNLKLGYGGTKQEMERLIADANEYAAANGMAADLTIDSFSDIVTAIDLVQQKQGIAGTTAREAASTVAGSLGMLKSAWDNLVAGLGDSNADLSQLINNVVDSAGIAFENLLPVVETAITGIGELVSKLGPILADRLPKVITNVLPSLISSAGKLVSAIGQGIIQNLPLIINSALQIMQTLITGLLQAIPQIALGATTIITELANGLAQALPVLIPAVVQIILAIVEALIDNIDAVIDAAIQIIMAIADGLIQALPILIEKAPTIIAKLAQAIITNAPKLLSAGINLVVTLVSGIGSAISQVIAAGAQLLQSLATAIGRGVSQMLAKGKELVSNFVQGIRSFFGNVRSAAGNIIDQVKSGITGKIKQALTWGKDLMSNFISGIKSKLGELGGALGSIGSKVKAALGHSHPTEGPMKDDYTWMPDMMDLFIKGIKDNENRLVEQAKKTFDLQDVVQGGFNVNASRGSSFMSGPEGEGARQYNAIINRMDRILEAVEAGQIISVDRRDFARLVNEVV